MLCTESDFDVIVVGAGGIHAETLGDTACRLAPFDERTAREVLANRIYRELSGAMTGSQEFTAVATLYELSRDERYDVLVLDCAPTGETLRLLSFPDVARWWLEKVFGRETQLLAAARPLARAFLAHGYGGLVLTVKPDERALWERYARETGRSEIGMWSPST